MRVKFIDLNRFSERTQLSIAWRRDDTNPLIANFLKVADSIDFQRNLT
jgi:hypothetical protein